MMIPKNTLSGEAVRQAVEDVLREQVGLVISGYKCDTSTVLNVVVKAAVERETIESVCSELALPVNSDTIRTQLKNALGGWAVRALEEAVNRGLASCFPAELPAEGCAMAIDWHDEPFYGKTAEASAGACRGQAKEGTPHFYRIASLYVLWRQVHLTLAMTYVLPDDDTLSVVKRLVERLHTLAFRPSVIYLDKGFCSGPVIRYLTEATLPALIACPLRGKQGGTRALCVGRRAYCTTYTFADQTRVRLVLVPTLVPDASGRRHRKWLAFVIIHLDWSARTAYQRYRRRFAIESSYRQFDRLHARTATRSAILRFFLLGLGLLLLNCWIHLRWLSTRVIARGPARWSETKFRLHRFIAFLRRAIENACGTIDSIGIDSW
jgi:hypothetical protein